MLGAAREIVLPLFRFYMASLMADMVEQATKPAKVSTDSGSIESHSIPDQITAEQHKATKTAKARSTSAFAGTRINRVTPPGTVGESS